MSAATLNREERELLGLFSKADDTEKEWMLNALICIVAFGDGFLEAIKDPMQRENRADMYAVVNSMIERVRATV
jgi:hypothetical protein